MSISMILTIVVASLRGAAATIAGVESFITNPSVKKVLDDVKNGMNAAVAMLSGVTSEFSARVKKGDAKADDANFAGIDAEQYKNPA